MKLCKYLIINILLIVSIHATAQKIAIANTKMNVVYVGLDNPIHVAIANYSSEAIIIKVSQGTITGENGEYVWRPITSSNEAFTSIFIKKNNIEKLISTITYRVKIIPNPITRSSDWQTQSCATYNPSFRLNGLVAVLDNFPYDVPFDITSFKVTIVRNGELFFEATNQGGRFQGKIARLVDMIQTGDIIHFSAVKCQYSGDGIVRTINDLIFKIT
jgi:hypothetical protein